MSASAAFGVIFDMDGVLVDSAEPHFPSWQLLAQEHGITVTRGKPDPQVFSMACTKLGIEPARCVVIEDAPGRYDPMYEQQARDYPLPFVRWPVGANRSYLSINSTWSPRPASPRCARQRRGSRFD